LFAITGKKNVRGSKPGPVLSWGQRTKIALSAATGLEFLHEEAKPCIVHTSIKSSNILIFDSDDAKIGGVGFSRQAPKYIDNILLDRMYPPDFGYDAPEYATKLSMLSDSSTRAWKIICTLLLI
jgi:pto-interacting protein 1